MLWHGSHWVKHSAALKKNKRRKSSLHKKKIVAFVGATAAAAVTLAATDIAEPQPKHTSILTGQHWIVKLLEGHSDRFHEQIGMSKHVFRLLLKELQLHHSLQDRKHVQAEEQLAIFLHFAQTGAPSCMLQEHFQRSPGTISVYVTHPSPN